MSEKKTPCCPKKVESLVANTHSPFQEADRDWLLDLNESQLDKLSAMADMLVTDSKKEVVINKEQAISVLKDNPLSFDEAMALLSQQDQSRISSGIKLYDTERKKTVDLIVANSDFTEEDLKDVSIDWLQKQAKSIKLPADYSGNIGGGADPKIQSNTIEILPPAGVEFKKEGGK